MHFWCQHRPREGPLTLADDTTPRMRFFSPLMAVLFYFHRVCCPCKGINVPLTKIHFFSWNCEPLSRLSNHQLKEYFFIPYLWVACGLLFLDMEHMLYCECYPRVCRNVLKNDMCKLYNTVCTVEEEWKTRNKYSFGVKSPPSRSVVFALVQFCCVLQPAVSNTMGSSSCQGVLNLLRQVLRGSLSTLVLIIG